MLKYQNQIKYKSCSNLQLYFFRSYLCWSLKLFISLLYWINSNLSCLLLFANINLFMETTNWVAAPAPAVFGARVANKPNLYLSRLPRNQAPKMIFLVPFSSILLSRKVKKKMCFDAMQCQQRCFFFFPRTRVAGGESHSRGRVPCSQQCYSVKQKTSAAASFFLFRPGDWRLERGSLSVCLG